MSKASNKSWKSSHWSLITNCGLNPVNNLTMHFPKSTNHVNARCSMAQSPNAKNCRPAHALCHDLTSCWANPTAEEKDRKIKKRSLQHFGLIHISSTAQTHPRLSAFFQCSWSTKATPNSNYCAFFTSKNSPATLFKSALNLPCS